MDKLAIKISISLPEALKADLDQYTAEHGLTASQTVQQALEMLFGHSPLPPTPSPGQDVQLEHRVDELGRELQDVQEELTRARQVLDRHRDYLLALRPLLDIAGIAATLPPSAFP